MITEDYVSFETAKLLKEKGFDGPCYKVWESHGDSQTLVGAPYFVEGETVVNRESVDAAAKQYAYEYNFNNNVEAYLAPTLQMAMKWLREVHDIHIDTHLSFSEDPINYPPSYYVYILDSKSGNSIINPAARIDGLNPLTNANNVPRDFNTYEQACEAAIKYCLENLI